MASVLLGLFLLFTIINFTYYLAFLSFAAAGKKSADSAEIPVSVIICAKNEAENLRNFLPSILEQDYPEFEVILINDASTDDSLEVIEEFHKIDGRIKIVNVENNEAFWANKKYALTLGIKKAVYPYLLFTDADCAPQSKFWIRKMAENFQENVSIVLGYGGYFKDTTSFLNKFIRFETLLTAVQFFSYAKLGSPYMGVGRNLAYTAKQFYEKKGFANHLHLRSGDDDLFINEAATKKNTAICYARESITRSVPKFTFKDWFAQKRRHVSVATHYKFNHRILLGLFYASQFLFWGLLPVLLVLQIHWEIVLIALGVRLLLQYIIFFKSAKKLDEQDLIWMMPLLEVFLICSQLGIFIANIFSKPTHWK